MTVTVRVTYALPVMRQESANHCDGQPEKEIIFGSDKVAYGDFKNNLGCENMISIWHLPDRDNLACQLPNALLAQTASLIRPTYQISRPRLALLASHLAFPRPRLAFLFCPTAPRPPCLALDHSIHIG